MASTPGVLTDWPWKSLGSFKYVVLAPWIISSTYSFLCKYEKEGDLTSFLVFPFMLWRMLHNQIWISLSRYQTAKGTNRIVDKGLELEQVDREKNWDDQILFTGILIYLGVKLIPGASNLPIWRTEGVTISILLHAGPVEFLYYWLHRALHHHYLYTRYHSHHHSSIVTEPISSLIHPFGEHIAYAILFAIPMFTTIVIRTGSIASVFGYITCIDFMNNMGHCNFELIPNWIFSMFPLLKYLMYTPSFHSLHHTQFRTNYSLFMPLYDYIYGTMDKSTDSLYESSVKRGQEAPDVVHLTHLTTLDSIYHLQVGFANFASKPYKSKWYLWLMWPVTSSSLVFTWVYSRMFVVERHRFDKLRLQTWAIPKYTKQYSLKWQNSSINNLIEEAILEAEEKGAKVLSLGLFNQSEELNRHGELFVQRHPKLKTKVVDGSSLAVALVLNSIPKGTTQVLFKGKPTKVAYAILYTLCQRGVKVIVQLHEEEYAKLNTTLDANSASNLVPSSNYSPKIWLVGDGVTEEQQLKACIGTIFIPFTQFPPKKARKDCIYLCTPAMVTPPSLENVHACENWLPRRVMSAWRIAGIVHALEGWNEHECGDTISNIDQVWKATLGHGFQPILNVTQTNY